MINNFNDFCNELTNCGFSMGGGNGKGIYTLIPNDWTNQEKVESPVKWHTGDADTDPWEWRMRVLEEKEDIAYGKVFFKSSGFITKEWYAYFLRVRRNGDNFQDIYEDGKLSFLAKSVYEAIEEQGPIPLHELKEICGITKEGKSAFEKVLTDLQMLLLITMSGRAQKINKNGEAYGWNSTVFCTTEQFWGSDITADCTKEEAEEKIREQILKLNPEAEEKIIKKFIQG